MSTKKREIISFDWAIKGILRDKSNFDVLEGFLSALLKDDIKILELLESESNQADEDLKYNRVDIIVKNKADERILIEVQYESEVGYFQRLLYASSKHIVENLDIGDNYIKVKKVISVSLIYFNIGSEDYVYHGKTEFIGIHNQRLLTSKDSQKPLVGLPERAFSEQNIFPEYFLIPLKAFSGEVKDDLDEWVYAFKNSEVLDEFHSKNIDKLRDKLDVLKMNKKERLAYDKHLDYARSARGTLEHALQEGEAKGKAEGKAEENARVEKIAKKLIESELDTDQISKITGLSIGEINSLK